MVFRRFIAHEHEAGRLMGLSEEQALTLYRRMVADLMHARWSFEDHFATNWV